MPGFTPNRVPLGFKVIVLITLPLLFVMATAFLLLDSIRRMDEQSNLANHSRQITDTTNALLKDLFTVGQKANLAKLYKEGKLRSFKTSDIPEINKAKKGLKKLSKLTRDMPREHKIVEDTRSEFNEAIDSFLAAQRNYIENNIRDFSGQAKYGRSVITEELVFLPKDARLKQDIARGKIQEHQDSVKMSLIALVVLSCLTTLTVIAFLYFMLTRRLAQLAQNTLERIKDEQSVEPISGNDEISDVDRAISGLVSALNETREREKAILENVKDVICTIDGAGKFATVNKASEEILGYHPDELIGKYYKDYIPENEVKNIASSIDAVVDGQGAQEFEGKMVKGSGNVIDLLWSCYWSDSDRELYLILHDISPNKQAERLRQEIISMVTHDLRSPLTGISLAYDFLKSDDTLKKSKEVVQLVNKASHACYLMNCLINDLLDVEKINSGQKGFVKEKVVVANLFESMRESLESSLKSKSIEFLVEKNEAEIFVDGANIEKVIAYLVENAAKLCEEYKTIKLSSEQTEEGTEISVSYEGRNIPPIYLPTLFDHYQELDYSSDYPYGVSGLSLTVCKAIIEQHGGEIWAENSISGGAFRFLVPACLF